MADYRDSGSTARRRDHNYNSQRTSISRPSTSNTQRRPSRQISRQPDDFWNLDISPPASDRPSRDDGPSSTAQERRGSTLNGDGSQLEAGAKRLSRHERNVSTPQQHEDTHELTEIAAPPPVREGDARQRHLGDDARADDEISGDDAGPYRPRTPAEYVSKQQTLKKTPRWLTELYTVSYLVFFAIWGTLARLGVQWLTFYPGTPVVTPVIWANFAGSFIMGFLAEDQALFRLNPAPHGTDGEFANGNMQHHGDHTKPTGEEDKASHTKRKKTIPLYIGLATGFCGSFTSFSSFARDYFLAISNDLPTPIDHATANPSPALIQSTVPRNGGYGFQAWLHIVLATLALSLGGLLTGAHLAIFAARFTPRIHGPLVQRVLDPAIVVLGWGCWLGALFLSIWPPDRNGTVETWRGEVLFALVFAPVGCLLRFYLSLKLNGLVPFFPLGTFAVNMLGTAIEGMCWDLQHVRIGVMGMLGGGVAGCQALQGVMDGFCGCLTTVSTWVAEINGLKRKHGWFYAFASVVGGLGLLVVIMGSVRWSVGWQDPVCATGYTGKVHG